MTTTEKHLTLRGDCIIGVDAEKGLRDLPLEMREMARNPNTVITMCVIVGNRSFILKGRGDPRLTYTDPKDIVARKSNYTCDRTLMVGADRAACDMDQTFVDLLKDGEQPIKVVITTEL
jgi:hypothetical protein